MTELRVLQAMASLIREVTEAAMVDITHSESLQAPIPGLNGMNWVLGHVTYVNARILELLEAPSPISSRELARYAPGAPSLADPEEAYDLEVLREALLQQGPLLEEALGQASSEILAGPPPPGFDGELRDFLHFLIFHQSYHAGQLGLLRRALGHNRAFG